jgi:glycosyltransferase involved in cell wall biosynthesis
MVISYAITTHNEYEEINELLGVLIHHIDSEDEIVILDDFSDEKTQEVFRSWTQQYGHAVNIKIEQRALNKDFAAQKNYLTGMCSGDYIINIDADEIPHDVFLNQIKQVIEMNDVDLIWVPRVNTVDGITQEHINKWGWRVDEKGWVNYPDYQARVYKNCDYISWVKPVHEHIQGAKTFSHLPPNEELSFYHRKKIDKQEQQNLFYSQIDGDVK